MKKLLTVLAAVALSTSAFVEAAGTVSANIKKYPEGDKVAAPLSEVKIQFKIDGSVGHGQVQGTAPITVKKDGAAFGTATAKGGGIDYTLTLEPEITEAGNYTIAVPEDSFMFIYQAASGSFEQGTNVAFDINYEVTGAGGFTPDTGNFDYTVNPEVGPVKELETVAIVPADGYKSVKVVKADEIKVTKDKKEFCGVTVADGTTVLTLATKATEPGIYTVTIPAEAIQIVMAGKDGGEDITFGNALIELSYEIEKEKTPVVYDVKATGTKPAEGTVDMQEEQFDSISVFVPEGMGTIDKSEITLASSDGSYKFTTALKTNSVPNQLIAWGFADNQPKINGEYTLTIPQGTFGDAEWQKDQQYGHSNPEITVKYTITGLKDKEDEVQYDLKCMVTPSHKDPVKDLSTITITIATEEKVTVAEDSKAILSSTEASYMQTAAADVKEGDTFVYKFETAPSKDGKYLLTIPEGTFTYTDKDNVKHANAEIALSYDFVNEVGAIDAIDAEGAEAPVYDVTGVCVGKSLKGLPAGLYIVKGKKVIVK